MLREGIHHSVGISLTPSDGRECVFASRTVASIIRFSDIQHQAAAHRSPPGVGVSARVQVEVGYSQSDGK